jgi:aryl-alcohol dehydrogenase-like predicted oxidoreductase
MTTPSLIPGHTSTLGTKKYVQQYGSHLPQGHYSDFLNLHYKLSSLGVGSFPGAADDQVDAQYAEIVERALLSGINVIDTAAHYRYGRSLAAVGRGIRAAVEAGVPRDGFFVVSKGGFLVFREGPPADLRDWFAREILAKGLGTADELTQAHLLSPAHIAFQIELSRNLLGLETLDAFLIDQPEVHIPRIGKAGLNTLLEKVFHVLEQAVKDGKIRTYGISTFNGFRVETDDPMFQSLTSMQGLAEKAARAVWQDDQARHAFKVVQMPFNQVLLEGFTRFNQATGQGNVASTFQAAHQLKIYLMSSHSLFKGHLAGQCVDTVHQAMPELPNHAQRALQFNRSTPGLGTALVGVSTPAHLDDLLAVAARPPLEKNAYLKLYQRTE